MEEAHHSLVKDPAYGFELHNGDEVRLNLGFRHLNVDAVVHIRICEIGQIEVLALHRHSSWGVLPRRGAPRTPTPSSSFVDSEMPHIEAASSVLPAQITLYPEHTYLHLTLLACSPPSSPVDALTAYTHMLSALTRHLGLTGSAINFDILKVGADEDDAATDRSYSDAGDGNGDNILSAGGVGLKAKREGSQDVWIRIHRDDAQSVVAALSTWTSSPAAEGEVSWRIRGWGESLGALVVKNGESSVWNG